MSEHSRLLWQCRRGIKEVEVILVPFLNRHYDHLSDDEKRIFEKVLDCADADLFEWFTERSDSDDVEVRDMVHRILKANTDDALPYQQ